MERSVTAKELAPDDFEVSDNQIQSLIEEASKEYAPSRLTSFEKYKSLLAEKIKTNFIEEFHTLRDGYTFLELCNSALKRKLSISPEIKALLKNPVRVTAALNGGKSYGDILGYSIDSILEIYAIARKLREEKQFYESGAIFKLLCLLYPRCHLFWLEGAEALEEDRRYSSAMRAYYGGVLANPLIFEFYLRICRLFCKMNQTANAQSFAAEILRCIEQDQQQEEITSESKQSLELLKKQLIELCDLLNE